MERLERGEFASPDEMPDVQRRLHRRAMAAIRRERQKRAESLSEDERRWPGLVNPPEHTPRRRGK